MNLSHFGRELVAEASFNDDESRRHADNERVKTKENAILVVGGCAAAPKGLGYDAEHGTAVEEEGPVGAEGELECSQDAVGANKSIVAWAGGGMRKNVRHRIRLHEPDAGAESN